MKSELRNFEILQLYYNPRWWERFLLLFRPKHYSNPDNDPAREDIVVVYKVLFGKIYVIDSFPIRGPGGD